MQLGIQRAVSMIRTRYYDPISLGDLASEAFFSPFHFSRVFSRETGVTPGRYLTAVRLFEAKRLLLTTSSTVSDIVCSVGYNSVGTFTSRFTRLVGMTPTQYRAPEVDELLLAVAQDFRRLPSFDEPHAGGRSRDSATGVGTYVTGAIELPVEAAPANVLVGVFDDAIPQSGPISYQYLANVGSSRLTIPNVPPGQWNVMAIAKRADDVSAESPLFIGSVGRPVKVISGRSTDVTLRMRALRPSDPPIAITLASHGSTNGDISGHRPLRSAA
ncbi:AraC-type DNA-binding protein [Actinopolyspora lacussalsi subsp. righensis]|uniref:AraC-type DNA-binding protein n=1 Tax=Actinopolyspora righensis TaxID=995060 RepID=A0A1I6XCI5_9ACTN|nr:AraC family transcriptional regulator [Actinopolyspora righensis]SFT36029.1 AraC-type DNA-binding protein [Actinopolyspora righensis]